jgi:dipeptidase
MAGKTNIEQQQIRQLANRHRETSQNIQQQQALLGGHIDTIAATNHSAMIDALKSAHIQWDEQVVQIRKTLEEMAESVDRVVTGLDSGDTDNAASVQSVTNSVGGLSGFLGQ